MRIFLALLVLIFSFQSWIKADDISEFEIEGMSIGDSLLDYISEEEITVLLNSPRTGWYPNKTFAVIQLVLENFNTYTDVGVIIKPNDSNYKIYALEGSLYFNKNIDECHKTQKKISLDLKFFFDKESYKFIESLDQDYIADESGDSKVSYLDFYFTDNSAVRIICWNFSEKINRGGNQDYLAVAVNSKKFMDWVDENM